MDLFGSFQELKESLEYKNRQELAMATIRDKMTFEKSFPVVLFLHIVAEKYYYMHVPELDPEIASEHGIRHRKLGMQQCTGCISLYLDMLDHAQSESIETIREAVDLVEKHYKTNCQDLLNVMSACNYTMLQEQTLEDLCTTLKLNKDMGYDDFKEALSDRIKRRVWELSEPQWQKTFGAMKLDS